MAPSTTRSLLLAVCRLSWGYLGLALCHEKKSLLPQGSLMSPTLIEGVRLRGQQLSLLSVPVSCLPEVLTTSTACLLRHKAEQLSWAKHSNSLCTDMLP